MQDPIWITEQNVVELMSLSEAVDALERGLVLQADGQASNMQKAQTSWGPGNTLHALGAVMEGAGFVGVKTWGHTKGGVCPLFIMWDSNDGSLLAVIEAFALGQMRTGSMSGVATRWLSAEDADELAIIGTGKQAITQVAAVHAARPLRRVRVFSPRAESRESFASKLSDNFDFEIDIAQSVDQAVDGAPIITLVTRAQEPFLYSEMVVKGAHINAVGAIARDRVELAQDIFDRVDLPVVDTLDTVRRLSREFIEYYESGPASWDDVQEIATVVKNKKERGPDMDLTLFKAMGMGVSDISLASVIYQKAVAEGLGRTFPHPERAPLRLT